MHLYHFLCWFFFLLMLFLHIYTFLLYPCKASLKEWIFLFKCFNFFLKSFHGSRNSLTIMLLHVINVKSKRVMDLIVSIQLLNQIHLFLKTFIRYHVLFPYSLISFIIVKYCHITFSHWQFRSYFSFRTKRRCTITPTYLRLFIALSLVTVL